MVGKKNGRWTAWLSWGVIAALTSGCAFGPRETLVQALDLEQAARELEVSSGVRLEPGERYAPPPLHGAVLRLSGRNGVELDLTDVVLHAAREEADPDRARGVAIEIVGCEGVVLRGGTLSGYRVGVLVRDSRDVTIEGLRIDGGFARRLESGVSTPDEDDRLELAPERGEDWLERYGAGVAIVDSSDVRVIGARAHRAQNGVVIASSFDCEVSDGDFSYLSGWGVALWRADRCTISRNRMDACLRGPLEGPRADGFGSAALLVSGSSSHNLFAFNRALGCGAGSLLVPGTGGAGEDNRWYGNLFAPANGPGIAVEGGRGLRLERNRVVGARGAGVRLDGVAGALLFDNTIESVQGAAIEVRAGGGCVVVENQLSRSDRGLELVGEGPAAGAEPVVLGNRFRANVLDVVLEGVGPVRVGDNRVEAPAGGLDLSGLVADDERELSPRERWALFTVPEGPLASGRARGVSLVEVGGSTRTTLRGLQFEAPPEVPGRASVVHDGERSVSRTPRLDAFGPWDPEAGRPYRAPIAPGGLLAGRGFEASWFRFDEAHDPRRDLEAWRAQRFDPLARGRIDAWRDPWGNTKRRAAVGMSRFGLVADGTIQLERAGACRLDATFDDGLRVLIDGVAVLEDWAWHPARTVRVEVELSAGLHEVRIEYFQLDGAAELALSMDPIPTPAVPMLQ